jgi:hypothetical protein
VLPVGDQVDQMLGVEGALAERMRRDLTMDDQTRTSPRSRVLKVSMLVMRMPPRSPPLARRRYLLRT